MEGYNSVPIQIVIGYFQERNAPPLKIEVVL